MAATAGYRPARGPWRIRPATCACNFLGAGFVPAQTDFSRPTGQGLAPPEALSILGLRPEWANRVASDQVTGENSFRWISHIFMSTSSANRHLAATACRSFPMLAT